MNGILFDFDGTIIKSMEYHYAGWLHALIEFGGAISPEDLYLLEGQGIRNVAIQLLKKNNISDRYIDVVMNRKKEYWEKNHQAILYPGVLECLDWLKEKNIPVGLVTGGDKSRVISSLKELKIDRFFSAVVTAEDVKFTKPHPEPFIIGAGLMKVSPPECVVVENAPMGIASAKAAGAYCLAITNTLNRDKLTQADQVVNDFYELLGRLKILF